MPRRPRNRITVALSVLVTGFLQSSGLAAQQVDYRDPQGRFTFSYPSSFGTTEKGTDDGFENRVAAIRFSVFSTQGVGGEAALGRGRPSIDVLAAGGLYDDIANGTLPANLKALVEKALPPLTIANFCDQLGRESHIDVGSALFAKASDQHRTALRDLDRFGNHDPKVSRCTVSGDTIVFDKEAAMVAGGPRRRTYGAVRFLSGRYSTFQLVRAVGTPNAETIGEMERVVRSLRTP